MPARTPVPAEYQTKSWATDKQLAFIEKLMSERELPGDARAKAEGMLNDGQGLTKKQASAWIERLLTLPRVRQAKTDLPDVEAGRYAVENAQGELRFYKVWRGRNGFTKLYVLHGPDEDEVHFKAMKPILDKIAADPREAALTYGREIGACSRCGRRLTNRISRELAIGPVCGGRLFGDEFKDEVGAAREAIIARGEDPDEEVA